MREKIEKQVDRVRVEVQKYPQTYNPHVINNVVIEILSLFTTQTEEIEKLKEYLCAEHGYSACPECIKDFRELQSELQSLRKELAELKGKQCMYCEG